MLKRLHMNKLNVQMLFFISLLIFASIAVSALFSISSMHTVAYDLKQKDVDTSLSLLEEKLTEMTNGASRAASVLSTDSTLISALSVVNTTQASQRAAEMAKELGYDDVTITDKTGIVLVRVHDSKAVGDSLAAQQDIQTALGGHAFAGIINEKSVQFSVVSAMPIIGSGGMIVGAVSVAEPLSATDYLDSLKKITGDDFTIFSADVRLSTTIMQDSKRVVGTKLSAAIANNVLEKKQAYFGTADILNEPYLTAYKPILSSDGTQAIGVLFSGTKVTEIEQIYNRNILVTVFGALGIAVIFDVIAFLIITRKIKRPLLKVVEAAHGIESGDIARSLGAGLSSVRNNNEIGILARSMEKAVLSLERIAADTDRLSDAVESNDLSVQVSTSEHHGIYHKIMTVVEMLFLQLKGTVTEIGAIAEQVSDGSSHLSNGAQELSRGAEEQSSAIQELFAAVMLISEKADKNAENGHQATDYISQASAGVLESNGFMETLLRAMSDMSSSSEKISKIIKIIDDISFQTNILALNAAVEAARAGAAGKGFSVVADEVRALALKSAEAASQTSALITDTINTISKGTGLANSTAASLARVKEKAALVERTNGEISAASLDQATAIAEIRQRLNAISSVVQNNTATAEESASISEELNNQADRLYREITKYRL